MTAPDRGAKFAAGIAYIMLGCVAAILLACTIAIIKVLF